MTNREACRSFALPRHCECNFSIETLQIMS
jgi:hypothetical protein